VEVFQRSGSLRNRGQSSDTINADLCKDGAPALHIAAAHESASIQCIKARAALLRYRSMGNTGYASPPRNE
jgi:hypothetical protein